MKKYAGMILAAVLLCGCNSNNAANVDIPESETVLSVTEASETEVTAVLETESASETTEIFTEPETAAGPKNDEPSEPEKTAEEIFDEKRVKAFAEFFESGGENGYVIYDQGNAIDVYDFMKGFRADKCSYTKREDGNYDIVITCSESANEVFPEGDSYWFFGKVGVGGFYPAEKEGKMIFPEDMYAYDESLRTAFRAAGEFSLYTDVYEADEAWFDTYEHMEPHDFYHYNPYMEKDENDESVTIEEHIRATKQLYNLNIPESAFHGVRVNEDGKVFPICGHGGTWNYTSLAGYEDTDSELKVTVDFYGDEYYFYPVIESEYTFSKNEDGTITLQRIEKIFDRGYSPAVGSV